MSHRPFDSTQLFSLPKTKWSPFCIHSRYCVSGRMRPTNGGQNLFVACEKKGVPKASLSGLSGVPRIPSIASPQEGLAKWRAPRPATEVQQRNHFPSSIYIVASHICVRDLVPQLAVAVALCGPKSSDGPMHLAWLQPEAIARPDCTNTWQRKTAVSFVRVS
jgi:hypothetical protein